jgi:phosphoribosylamine---glycine ligase
MLPLIDEPLLPIFVAAATGRLTQSSIRINSDSVVGVVLASRGYPESSESDRTIIGIDEAEALPGVSVYHAGTASRGGNIVTAGGRVLTVTGRGADFAEAISRAYAGVAKISFDGMQYRRDIGRRALEKIS